MTRLPPRSTTTDIARLAPGLRQQPSGWWEPDQRSKHDYRDGASDFCFDFEDHSFWFEHRNNCIRAAAERHSMWGSFLDIGAGNGFVARDLQRTWPDLVGLDPSTDAVENMMARGIGRVVCSTLQDAGFTDGAFDNCGAFDVVEHIADDTAFLREMHRCTHPGGLAMFTVPAHRALWSGDDVHAGHHRRYSLPEMVLTLRQCGFEALYATHLFGFLTLPVFLARSLPHRLGFTHELGASASQVRSVASSRPPGLHHLLTREVASVRAGRTRRFGTSILVVSRAR